MRHSVLSGCLCPHPEHVPLLRMVYGSKNNLQLMAADAVGGT
jgi:hypothetical protein